MTQRKAVCQGLIRSTQMLTQETADAVKRSFRGRKRSHIEWEDVHHARPEVQLRFFAAGTFRIAPGVIPQNLVFAHVQAHRRQTGQITEKWGRQRVPRVLSCEVARRCHSEAVLRQQRVRLRPIRDTGTAQGKISPGRHHCRTPGLDPLSTLRQSAGLRQRHQRQAAAGRVTGQGNRRVPKTGQPLVSR